MKFSIITPVYNRTDCISRCIDSVLKQNQNIDFEYIIVDDGSKDNTPLICKNYADKNAKLIFIQFKENKGTNAARNAAIKVATGDFIIILDSDDYFVDDALDVISITMKDNPGYLHYMFAPDDVNYNDSFFNNCGSKELYYSDFLRGVVKKGFIHCISAGIMKHHLFDEAVRIYESVFFLSFYKDEQKMLFTNKIVTIRERGRRDSVTLDAVRTKKIFIERYIRADEIMLVRFGEDLKKYDCKSILLHLYTRLFDNYILLGNYTKIKELKSLYYQKYINYIPKNKKVQILNCIQNMRLGLVYWILLKSYLLLKYKILNYKIK